ncbi:hypothetical protein FSA02_03610 [Phocaeicola dorei]|uniref:Transposase n=2 Tax=Phocaeicola TaxID=909656 RepID=A0A7J5MGQ4_PHOVU|nr:hypothetical protein F9Z94_02895 [Phocaeicola vulgatus]TWV76006.1 hypothetical protein FSA04_04825 [Phocaeicola dorei]TWV91378.1 hypothetical protein FSA02_03610 [Phocaeicola dorei]
MEITPKAMEIEYIRIKRLNLEKEKTYAIGCDMIDIYNPQIEMFARFKMKSSFHKTKRII